MKAQKLTQIAMLTALAMILSYIELLLPVQIGIPGAKLGLANFVVLTALYLYGIKEACYINLIRIILIGLLFGNFYSILYSVSGAVISMMLMLLLKKIEGFSVIGVSVGGSIGHNIGQLLVAFAVTSTTGVLYYFPFLMIVGMVSGFIIGILVRLLLKTLRGILSKNGDWDDFIY